jgi:hypothetical protein
MTHLSSLDSTPRWGEQSSFDTDGRIVILSACDARRVAIDDTEAKRSAADRAQRESLLVKCFYESCSGTPPTSMVVYTWISMPQS